MTLADLISPARRMRPARDRLELTLGKVQHRALRFALVRAAGLRESRVTVERDGHTLTAPYFARGLDSAPARPPAVLVHGFGANKESWLMMTACLPRRRPVILVDLPGFGAASPIPGSLSSPAAQARSLLAILDRIGVDRVDLVGNSMGGGISLRLCHDAGERVRSLTLINSIGPGKLADSDFARRLDRGDNALIPGDEESAARMLALVAEKKMPLPRALVRYVAREQIALRPRLETIFAGWLASSPRDALPGDLGAVDVPSLVVCGDRDRIIAPATGRALARALPHAELQMLPGIGHVPQLEAPLRVARLLERFWSTSAAGRARSPTGST